MNFPKKNRYFFVCLDDLTFKTFYFHFLSLPLFFRFERLKAKDNDFNVRFAHLGNLGVKNGVTEFNWDSNIDEAPSSNSGEHH